MQVSFYYYFLRFPDGPLGTAKIQRNALPAKNKVKIKKCDPIVIEVVCPCLEGGIKCPSESQRGQQQESVCFLGVLDLFFLTWYLYHIALPFPQSPPHWPCSQLQGPMLDLHKRQSCDQHRRVIFQFNTMRCNIIMHNIENGLAYVNFLALL